MMHGSTNIKQKISLPSQRLSDSPKGLCSIESSVIWPTARKNYTYL